ncbi:chromatin-remodeling complex ATPase chain [Achlya hypogyna]|uniref:Chromatin-remodeling complex ATPase chain n=1 Tax=Achlya hypogyna TaxID=1202772 RepID=A0A1V9ZKL2_ACHHY|nr:chromatin-remodeling complex ATPase chain [Achlya hypogyna]
MTTEETTPAPLVKPKSAYAHFQKHVMGSIRMELAQAAPPGGVAGDTDGANVDLGVVQREVSARWANLTPEEREPFIDAARTDRLRFDEECLARDRQVEEERARKREDRDKIEGKRERKPTPEAAAVREKKRPSKPLTEEQLESKRARQEVVSQARSERDALRAEEQKQKDELIAKKAQSASARLQYLLSQSDIFKHFGVTEPKKSSKKAKKSEREEDDELLHDKHDTVRLTVQPSVIKFGTMRQYQLEGLSWMVNLANQGINGILADEMGLGKTLQTISVLGYFMEFKNVTGPHIVLVPKSTLSNWLAEFHRWCPSLRAVKFHGDKDERQRMIDEVLCPGTSNDQRKFDVCVTTFEMCLKAKTTLCKFAWRYLIIDEAHRIKNESSQFSTVVRMLATEHRLLLTGTPLQNNLHELWALLNFLLPDVFSSSEQFDEWFNLDTEDEEAKKQMITQLHRILRPFMLRRLKADVEKSLPPKKETLLFVGMTPMQKALYKTLLLRDMNTLTGGTTASKSALQNIVMQLRKCCGHPYLFEGQEDRTLPPMGEHLVDNCGKMILMDKLLRRLKERGSRVLIFSQMTRVLDIMEDYCRMRAHEYCRIDGQTSYDEREASIEAYNAPNSSKFIFLLSTRAGGLGINLYTADIVILYDSDWNPQADLQAQDRAHRIGQKKEVHVYRFVTSNSVEEKIIERAQQKLKLDAMVVQQGRLQEKQKNLSKADMLDMIRFGADEVFRATDDQQITDDDIDAILANGEARTEEMNQKMQAHDKGDLLNFKLDGGNMQVVDGVDYSKEKERLEELKRLADLEFAKTLADGMGKRERRTVLKTDEVSGKVKASKMKQLPKALRLPRMDEWQFYQRQRLVELHEMEVNAYEAAKAAATDELKEANYLPPELQEEKDELISQAFADWNKPQFFLFVKLLARYGRANLTAVAREMSKPLDEVTRYAETFWRRGSELNDWEKLRKSIEKGESKLLEIERLAEQTALKVKRYENPLEDLVINYQGKGGKLFTEEEDRLLLCLVNTYGYGSWDKIKREIHQADVCTFDYYLKSRSAAEIGRRCDALMRICEKDNVDFELKEKRDSALRVELQKQREELAQRIADAKADLNRNQARVDEMIMKEAKKMQAQREAKRAKKEPKPAVEKKPSTSMSETLVEELVQMIATSTDKEASTIALKFCAKHVKCQLSSILQQIQHIATPIGNAKDGQPAWDVHTDYLSYLPTKKRPASVLTLPSEETDGKRLPKSPWSPTAMKQATTPSKKAKRGSDAKKPVKKPRSAYVLFSLAKRNEVRASMPEGTGIVELMSKLTDLWLVMTDEEKEPWNEAQEKDKLRYEREMHEDA